MEKSAQPGESGGARPSPFTKSAITYKVVVYAPAERADTLPLFIFYPYALWLIHFYKLLPEIVSLLGLTGEEDVKQRICPARRPSIRILPH